MKYLSKFHWNSLQKKKKKTLLKLIWKQKSRNIQNNTDKAKQNWRHHASKFQTIVQSYSNQNRMVLKNQIHRPTKQNKKSWIKPTYIWWTDLQKSNKSETWQKDSLLNKCVLKTGYSHVKEWNRIHISFHTQKSTQNGLNT